MPDMKADNVENVEIIDFEDWFKGALEKHREIIINLVKEANEKAV